MNEVGHLEKNTDIVKVSYILPTTPFAAFADRIPPLLNTNLSTYRPFPKHLNPSPIHLHSPTNFHITSSFPAAQDT